MKITIELFEENSVLKQIFKYFSIDLFDRYDLNKIKNDDIHPKKEF